MKQSLCLFFLLFVSKLGFANDWHFSPFLGFDGQYTFIKADKDDFNPVIGRFRVGSYLYKTVGFEFAYAIPLHTDSQYNIDVSIENNYVFNIRWESPAEEFQGLSAYILTGYAVNEIQFQNQNAFSEKETYKGFNIGIGFKQTYYERIGIYVEYNYQYFKDDLRISGVSLGGQIEF